jgi:type IV pilus assembly protein PilB
MNVEQQEARELARRYRLDYYDLTTNPVDHELINSLPVELMLRNHFVPLKRDDEVLLIALADPSNYDLIDELSSQLKSKIKIAVATRSAIEQALKRGETSQRVLKDATRSLGMKLVKETEQGEEDLDIDRLTEETSPIIKLVDTVILNALERRVSDIHIETGDNEVNVKYRIDGAPI